MQEKGTMHRIENCVYIQVKAKNYVHGNTFYPHIKVQCDTPKVTLMVQFTHKC